jgi:hypothetical protein
MGRDNIIILLTVGLIFLLLFLFIVFKPIENPRQESFFIENDSYCPKFGLQPGEKIQSPLLTENKYLSFDGIFDKLIKVSITNSSPTAITVNYRSDSGKRYFLYSLNPDQSDSKSVPVGVVEISLYPNDQQILDSKYISTDSRLTYNTSLN